MSEPWCDPSEWMTDRGGSSRPEKTAAERAADIRRHELMLVEARGCQLVADFVRANYPRLRDSAGEWKPWVKAVALRGHSFHLCEIPKILGWLVGRGLDMAPLAEALEASREIAG